MIIFITTNCIMQLQEVSANAQTVGRIAVKLLPYTKAAAKAAITTVVGFLGFQTYDKLKTDNPQEPPKEPDQEFIKPD